MTVYFVYNLRRSILQVNYNWFKAKRGDNGEAVYHLEAVSRNTQVSSDWCWHICLVTVSRWLLLPVVDN